MLTEEPTADILRELLLTTDKPIVFFDLETTGLNTTTDRIVEIALVKIHPSGEREEKLRRINPGIPIPESASAVHGIYDADVCNEIAFENIGKAFFEFLEGCHLAGFNIIGFDIPLLKNEFKRCNLDFSTVGRHVVDLQKIYHLKEPRDLTAAYLKYTNKALEGAHAALSDVDACIEILAGQSQIYPDIGISIQSLHEACHVDQENWVDEDGKIQTTENGLILGFGKHSGTTIKDMAEQSPDYLHWILSNDFSETVKTPIRAVLYND